MAESAEADGAAPSVPSTLEERSQGHRVIVILQRVSDRTMFTRAVISSTGFCGSCVTGRREKLTLMLCSCVHSAPPPSSRTGRARMQQQHQYQWEEAPQQSFVPSGIMN